MEPPRAHRSVASQAASAFKWKTVIALILLLNAMLLNWTWVFGILFIAWAISDIIAGRIYFVEAIIRTENPILFWIIAGLWILMGLYYLVEPLWQFMPG